MSTHARYQPGKESASRVSINVLKAACNIKGVTQDKNTREKKVHRSEDSNSYGTSKNIYKIEKPTVCQISKTY